MKKVLSFLLSLIVIAGIMAAPVQAQAAPVSRAAGVAATSGSRLNVRSSASTSAPIVAAVSNGSYITLLSKTGSWWRVEYGKGLYGYCHADYIAPVFGTSAWVSTQYGSLNVRSGAGTSFTKTGSLAKGENIVILSSASGWSRILYHGTKTGYVSSRYLSNYFGAVSLNVPSFKQTDSRWASIPIGSSGKTMAQIGCVTTAVAMMESYRTGTTVHPDAMAKKLRYTAGGSLYWPENLIPVTSSSGYLSKIYSLLQQGKPVLLGGKDYTGKQHWVVITGFTGGTSLTADRFTIHDPGTIYRTNLQQFLSVYPVFYKYFYSR